MKQKISNYLSNLWDETGHRLRLLCCNLSPMRQFITILIIGGALATANIYIVVTSIYNMGKRDAETEFLQLQYIESLKLRQKGDSIFSIENGELNIDNLQIENNDNGYK